MESYIKFKLPIEIIIRKEFIDQNWDILHSIKPVNEGESISGEANNCIKGDLLTFNWLKFSDNLLIYKAEECHLAWVDSQQQNT